MKVIPLTSEQIRVDEIKKPTKARFFKYLEVGDVFIVSCYLNSVRRSRSGLHASNFTFKCEKDGEIISDSMTANQAINCLDNFVISKVCK